MENNQLFLICSCNSLEHQMMFWYGEDEKCNIVYTEVHLTGRSFFKRLWYGLQYIFGYKCRYGAWDEFIFQDKGLKELKDFLNNLPLKS